jgi:flagellar biosynthetic protein FliP
MRRLNRHFVRHYLEMVVVMFLGMAVLWLPAGLALGAFGSSWTDLQQDAPALMLALMAFTMTAPMAAWMHRKGHSIRVNAEMAASMIVPTILLIALLAVGAVSDGGSLLLLEHLLMLPAMFGVMLLRPDEYSGHHHNISRAPAAA